MGNPVDIRWIKFNPRYTDDNLNQLPLIYYSNSLSKNLLNTLLKVPCDRMPVWFMRQAGRYLPEYKAYRKQFDNFLSMCFTPEAVLEITLQPLHRFDFDAAILFSDILVIPEALGQKVSFIENIGPVLAPYVPETLSFSVFDETLSPVIEGIHLIKKRLPPEKTFIGFVGAPWTIATYMLEGKSSRQFDVAKFFALKNTDEFLNLIDMLTAACIRFIEKQILAGVDVIQIFDSWAGVVPDFAMDAWVIRPFEKIISETRKKFPCFPFIGFPKGAQLHLEKMAHKTGVNGLSLDSSIPLEFAKKIQEICVTQGNLDPHLLKAGGDQLVQQVLKIQETLGKKGRHIFNLGHGILPDTPLENVEKVLSLIRS